MRLERLCKQHAPRQANNEQFLPPSLLPTGTVLDKNPLLKNIYIDELNKGSDEAYQPWIEGADKLLPQYLTEQFESLPATVSYN